jgi:hypothetical protein
MVAGRKELLADAWYDNNLVLKQMFKKGYLPVVKPNKGRVENTIVEKQGRYGIIH